MTSIDLNKYSQMQIKTLIYNNYYSFYFSRSPHPIIILQAPKYITPPFTENSISISKSLKSSVIDIHAQYKCICSTFTEISKEIIFLFSIRINEEFVSMKLILAENIIFWVNKRVLTVRKDKYDITNLEGR
jgi:hypothetical protein